MAQDKNKKDKIPKEIDDETEDMTIEDAKNIDPEVAEKDIKQPAEQVQTEGDDSEEE